MSLVSGASIFLLSRSRTWALPMMRHGAKEAKEGMGPPPHGLPRRHMRL